MKLAIDGTSDQMLFEEKHKALRKEKGRYCGGCGVMAGFLVVRNRTFESYWEQG